MNFLGFIMVVVIPVLLLARHFYKDLEKARCVEGFMKHIRVGDMEAAEAYWKEHFGKGGPELQRELSEREERWAALIIKAGKSPETVIDYLNRRRIEEQYDPLLDSWEESGLEGVELRDFMVETLKEAKRHEDSQAA